ncbi:MAG: hypothetical protein H7145_12310 [Akkermansiaceae bacterium]|nr:hypothetical protein [Armatimonadota bacterium]
MVSALLHLDELSGAGVADIDAAERFKQRLDEPVNAARVRIAHEILEEGKPLDSPDEAASYALTQTVYRLGVETARKRARRSSAGLWFVFYALRDTNGDGVIDTFRVLRLIHSVARPVSKTSVRETDD